MIKMVTKYHDVDGVEQTGESYFNITKREAISLMAKYGEDIMGYVSKLSPVEVIDFFEELVLLAYGVRSEDGKKFIKNKENSEEYKQTLEFDQLILDLMVDENKSEAFVLGTLNINDEETISNIKNAINDHKTPAKTTPKKAVKKSTKSQPK